MLVRNYKWCHKINFVSLLCFYHIFFPKTQNSHLGLFLSTTVRSVCCPAQKVFSKSLQIISQTETQSGCHFSQIFDTFWRHASCIGQVVNKGSSFYCLKQYGFTWRAHSPPMGKLRCLLIFNLQLSIKRDGFDKYKGSSSQEINTQKAPISYFLSSR